MQIEAPFARYTNVARPEWIDGSGRLGVSAQAWLFEEAARAFFRHLDLSQAYRERTNHAFFALEQHFTFEHEILVGDRVAFTSQILEWSPRRLVCLHALHHANRGERAAFNEVLYAHIDLAQRRSAPLPDALLSRLLPIFEAHARLPRPSASGQGIRLDPP